MAIEIKIEGEAPEVEKSEEGEPVEAEASDDSTEEEVLSIGFKGEEPEESEEEEDVPAPKWVKELRVKTREKDKEIRELKAQLAKLQPKAEEPKLPAKPTLAEYEFDEDKYNEAYEQWLQAKSKITDLERQKREQEQRMAKEWQDKVAAYTDAKSKLRVPDFEDAEDAVNRSLSDVQKQILIDASDNPALLVYALGKSASKLKELASITNYARFSAQLAKLEASIHTKKKSPPQPERRIQSSLSSVSFSRDVDRLADEALKSGDVTSLVRAMGTSKKGK